MPSARLPKEHARYGGDEFVIKLPETAKAQTRMVAEKICKFVSDYPFPGRETQPQGKVTLSIGIATFPMDGMDGSSLINGADQALYQAKKNGRNQLSSLTKELCRDKRIMGTPRNRSLKTT